MCARTDGSTGNSKSVPEFTPQERSADQQCGEQEYIVNALPLQQPDRERFERLAGGAEQWFIGPAEEGLMQLPEHWQERATVILGNLPPALVAQCSKLRWLQTGSAGVNTYQGILPPQARLTSASGAYGQAVSEHMFALMWALMKQLPLYRDQQLAKTWRPLGQVLTARGASVLVLGTGDLGSHFAQLVQAVGAHTVGVRRNATRPAAGIEQMHTFEDLDQLLPQADVVALALPAAGDTHHMIDERRLKLMKSTAILINAGRGDAVDCAALARVLAAGHLWGAGLDVSEPEPLPANHPLWEQPRCLMTPHVAGGYHLATTRQKVLDIAAANMERYMNGQELVNLMSEGRR
ncbi:2-hydroxyacid dehydrogenase [Bombiscardovia nodaiensis]|uniref:2-hydroxyacid dehydrogenase n=1 Tax=Bombiscardovia nodaiensis TaxID=2932181 RepID=A0ABN6SBY6_9BIFI|nr:2-hydroxyacid dehydrogenase [Bombiscardovia nodaiensis]